ncbi:MAG: hypothetical protein PF590_06285 [Candidatus Delongbacteria bacterium]|nr:hypothetical protein [Candidatus Delongbacteria bacterium]
MKFQCVKTGWLSCIKFWASVRLKKSQNRKTQVRVTVPVIRGIKQNCEHYCFSPSLRIGILPIFVSVMEYRNMIKSTILSVLVVGLVFLTSCKSDWYNVPESTEPYVEKFDTYAQQQGIEFDFEEIGLIIEFSNLGEDTAARCNYEDPIRIELDEETWAEANEDTREAIMMRYMALGFLNRQNTNAVFPNGEWTSLMRGTPYEVDKKMHHTLNYFGFRKPYYVDELFTENRYWPWWADHQTSYDSIHELESVTLLNEQFLGDVNVWEQTNMTLEAEINNGEFRLQNGSNSSEIAFYDHDLDMEDDFKMECIIKIENSNSSDFSGFIWGASDHNAYYFTGYDLQHNVLISNSKENFNYCFSYVENENIADFLNYNKLTVVHLNDLVYVFLNENFVYLTDIHELYGDRFGFKVGANSTLGVDRLTIEQLK